MVGLVADIPVGRRAQKFRTRPIIVGITKVMKRSITTVIAKLVRTRLVYWPSSSLSVKGTAAGGVLHCDHQSANHAESTGRSGVAQDVGGRARVPRVLGVLLTRTE